MQTKRAGFTLVEILVVISLLGILLSIVVFSGSDARSTAKATIADQDVQQIGLALQLYLETNNELPSTGNRTDWSVAADELYPDYLSKEMVNDAWGNEFEYENNYGGGVVNRGSFICSAGPDGTFVTSPTNISNYEAGGDDICRFIFDED
jgi:type II secretion system protein G